MTNLVFTPVSRDTRPHLAERGVVESSPMYHQVKMRRGFSLVEILATLTCISLLLVLAPIGFQSVFGTKFDSNVSDLATLLVRARAYAMANNTYTFVGLQETDDSVPATTTPQTAGNGRLGVSIVASNDGTRIYSPSAPSALTPTYASSLTVVAPLRHFENVHLLSTSGIANRPNSSTGSTYNVFNTNSLTTFQWPLTGTAQYSFGANPGTVIQFSPQGEAQIMPTGTTTDCILQWIEIDLEATHGKQVPTTAVNTASILIVGASGAVTLYRQ
jgi:prepilin-type N-terminal cleavage/methylation domain-containing protein